MVLARKLEKKLGKANKRKAKEPVWKGPEQDGITQSLLSRFLVCRERFRLLVVEGLRPADQFNHRMEYGQMWHTCEEELARTKGADDNWQRALKQYASGLCRKYPLQQEQVQHWYNVCKVQFPVYVNFWAKHPDVKGRTPLLQEQVFDVPYTLPSGRMVRLRGKWDSVDLIGKGKAASVYLQENKSMGDIKEEQLKRQLASGFDLQTMLYLVAMDHWPAKDWKEKPIRGVRYNVVRRPLSGGKGSIKQLQNVNKGKRGPKAEKLPPRPETSEEYYVRLGTIIEEEPEFFFMRWKVEITPADIERFRRECLDPILEQLYHWWEWVSHPKVKEPWYHSSGHHFRYPYGVWNTMLEGGVGEVDEYLNTGSELGLERTDNLFRELDSET